MVLEFLIRIRLENRAIPRIITENMTNKSPTFRSVAPLSIIPFSNSMPDQNAMLASISSMAVSLPKA